MSNELSWAIRIYYKFANRIDLKHFKLVSAFTIARKRVCMRACKFDRFPFDSIAQFHEITCERCSINCRKFGTISSQYPLQTDQQTNSQTNM